MRLKHSTVIFSLIFAIARINAENFEDFKDSQGKWEPYKIHGVAHTIRKIPRPIPPPSYIGIWQNPIEISTAGYENTDGSQNVPLMDASSAATTEKTTTEPFLESVEDATPITPIYPPMGPALRPTLPPRPILRPTPSNAESELVQNQYLQQQFPFPDRGYLRPTLPARPIAYPTTATPIQFQTSELPSNTYQPGRPTLTRPILPLRPVPRPIPRPTLINTITTPNPSNELATKPISNSDIKDPIVSDTVAASIQTGRPIISRPTYPMRPIPRPIPRPTLIDTIPSVNPAPLEPITEPTTQKPDVKESIEEVAMKPNNNLPAHPIQTGRPIISRPIYPMRPIPRPVPQPTLVNIIPPTNPVPLEPTPELTSQAPDIILQPTVEPKNPYPIQTGRPILPIPRPVPQPTFIYTISPTNSTLVEPESSDPAPNNEPASSSELSSSPVTEVNVIRPNYQRPILPSRPVLQPTQIAPRPDIPTSETLSTLDSPSPGTERTPAPTEEPFKEIDITTQLTLLPEPEAPPAPSPEPIPQPQPQPSLPTERPILPVGRPAIPYRPVIEAPDNVIEPKPISAPTIRPESIRPTLPSRPIYKLPSYPYNPPINRPIFPARPVSAVTEYPTTPIMGKTLGDVMIDGDSELSVKPEPIPAFPAITQPSTPLYPIVTSKPSHDLVAYPQRPILPPATSSPVQQPIQSYVPAPIDIEILKDYRCPRIDGYFSIVNECDTYVECKKNVAFKYSCPDGLHFNPNAIWPEYACGYPSEVKCNSNAMQHAPRPTALCPRQYGYFPSGDGDCSRFTLCQEGLAKIMSCPNGLAFNPDTSSCDWPANVPSCRPSIFQGINCPEPPAAEDGSPSDLIYKFRYRNRCREYIACQHGHPRLLSCDAGLHFDESSQSCISADFVKTCEF